jgi:hypothetical protein
MTDNNINERIEQEVQLQFDQVEHKKLLDKYQDRTQVQAFERFIRGCKHSRTILQSLSFVLGFGFALMMAIKMPRISMFIFSLCLILLFLIEYSKRWTLDKHFELEVVNKKKSAKTKIDTKALKMAILVLISLSATISFVGSPYVVKFFAKHEPLIQLNRVSAYQDSLIKLDTLPFNQKKIASIASSATFLVTNGKLDRYTKKWRIRSNSSKTFDSMQKEVLSIDNKINSILLEGVERKAKAIEVAEEKNAATISAFDEWCFKFGWVGSIAAILIDLIIIGISFVISGHEERKLQENFSRTKILGSLEESKPKVKEQRTPKVKEKKEEPVFQEVKTKSIQEVFASSKEKVKEKEGSFVDEQGERKVLLFMKKGKNKNTLQSKSKSEIKNAIVNQSNQQSERTLFLKDILKQF